MALGAPAHSLGFLHDAAKAVIGVGNGRIIRRVQRIVIVGGQDLPGEPVILIRYCRGADHGQAVGWI